MRVLLDTSVLVAALVGSHPRHELCWPYLSRCQEGSDDLVLAAHSLAELYSVLTTLPVRPRISPGTAKRLAEDNGLRPRPHGMAEVRALSVSEYVTVLDGAAGRSLTGGIIYDALLAKVAETAEVDRLLTLNVSHFRKVWPEGAERIHEPS